MYCRYYYLNYMCTFHSFLSQLCTLIVYSLSQEWQFNIIFTVIFHPRAFSILFLYHLAICPSIPSMYHPILVKSMGRVDVVLSPHLEWSTLCFPEPKIINAIIACLSLLNAMAALGFAAAFLYTTIESTWLWSNVKNRNLKMSRLTFGSRKSRGTYESPWKQVFYILNNR